MPASLNFEFQFRAASAPKDRDDSLPMRMLILGDFSGRANRNAENAQNIAQRPVISVDLDNLDKTMARLGARLQLPLGADGQTHDLEFKELDDFLPDSLYRALPLFKALRDTRARISNPATFAAAAAELGLTNKPTQQVEASAPAEGTSSAFESLLGGKVNRPAGLSASGGNSLDALIKNIVAPHIVAGPDPLQAPCLAAVDAAISEQMRAILHHPAFQALEAGWRGVQFLITSLELDEELQLHLLDVSKNELLSDITDAKDNLEKAGIHHVLVEKWQQSPDGAPWSALMGNYSFTNSSDDVALLAGLGAIARQTDAPFMAAADSSIAGCPSLASEPEPRNWQPIDSDSAARWQALRTAPQAQWLGLTAPRLLLRMPYGANTDRVEQFEFEEFPGLPVHEHYLWGNGAFACLLVLGQAFTADGWDMHLGGASEIGDLPAHTYRQDGEPHMQPCAEINLSQRGGEALQKAGLMPLHSHKNRNAVQLPSISSLTFIPSILKGPWLGD